MAHTIHLEEGSNYRFGPLELEEAKLHIKEYLEKGWIEPNISPYGWLISIARKKDGGLRKMVDH